MKLINFKKFIYQYIYKIGFQFFINIFIYKLFLNISFFKFFIFLLIYFFNYIDKNKTNLFF